MNSSHNDFPSDPLDIQYVTRLLADLHSFDPGIYEKSISTLQSLDRDTVINVLDSLVGCADPRLRSDAAEALLRIDPRKAVNIVQPLLFDSDSSVRWNTCGLLHDFGDKTSIPAIVKVLLDDPDSDVRWMAAWALGEIGDHSALPALHQAAESDNGADREGRRISDVAVEAIEEILARIENGEPE